jgi:hypothetical protein
MKLGMLSLYVLMSFLLPQSEEINSALSKEMALALQDTAESS